MTLAISMLALIAAFSMRFRKSGPDRDFLAKEQCNAIKGISILLVFLSHFASYIPKDCRHVLDRPYFGFTTLHGQLIVAMFLFYSGYGVMESLKAKGREYAGKMPKRRLLSTILNFDIAVAVFFVFGLLRGESFGLGQTLLALTGWESLGNSNWYIFTILGLYAATWLAAIVVDPSKKGFLPVFAALAGLFTAGLALTRPPWWHNTALCYFAGVFFSRFKDRIVPFVRSHYAWTLTGLAIPVLALLPFPHARAEFTENMLAVAFSLLVVALTMKIKVESRFLCWCGASLFPIYIYQRLPMMAFKRWAPGMLEGWRAWIALAASLAATLAIAKAYPKFRIR